MLPDGRFLQLRPDGLTVVDLRTAAVRSTAWAAPLGDPMLVRADGVGRLAVVDDARRVWVCAVDDPAPVEVARLDAPASGLEVHDGAWWVVDRQGTLTTLR